MHNRCIVWRSAGSSSAWFIHGVADMSCLLNLLNYGAVVEGRLLCIIDSISFFVIDSVCGAVMAGRLAQVLVLLMAGADPNLARESDGKVLDLRCNSACSSLV